MDTSSDSQVSDFIRPKLEPKGDAYRLTEDWLTDCKGVLAYRVLVPSGFVTDGASIPRLLWRLCGTPMDVPRIYAAIVHDWLYERSGRDVTIRDTDDEVRIASFDRKTADAIYRDYQIALGISKFKAYTEYHSLRLFGSSHWNNSDND